MVRNYVRKTQKGSYSEDAMQRVLETVQNKEMSIKKASVVFKVPRTSIHSRLKRQGLNPVRNLGRFKPVFTEKMEMDLSKHIINLEKLFYGLSTTDLRRIAFHFAEANQINHPFNKDRKLAGKDWLISFLKRQGNLSIRRPEATSIARVTGFSKHRVSEFFENLEEILDKYNFPPHKIFNCDETGITCVQKPGKILAEKGRKQVGRLTSLERGKNTTLLACVSATGTFIPPFVVFPRVRMNPTLLNGAFPGTVGFPAKSGWMDADLFVKFLKHFIDCTKTTKESPSLLILDGHSSHKSIESINLARNSGVIILTLPPHTSNRLQPLDVSVFGPFKTYLAKEMDNWLTNHPGSRITEYDMAPIIKNTLIKAFTPINIIKGFEKTGIYPYDPDVFQESDFEAAENILQTESNPENINPSVNSGNLANVPNPESPEDDIQSDPGVLPAFSEPTEKPSCSSVPDPIPRPPHSKNNTKTILEPDQPSCSYVNISNLSPIRRSPQEKKDTKASLEPEQPSCSYVPISKLSPIPKPSQKKRNIKTKSRTTEGSKIITSSPYKDQLEEKLKEKLRTVKAKSAKKSFGQARPSSCVEKVKKRGNLDEKKKVTSAKAATISEEEKATICVYCHETYGDTWYEEWIMCVECGAWMHEECSDNEPGANNYVCENCR